MEIICILSKSDPEAEFNFTPENLLDNLDKLGAWSCYGLASNALRYYFPDEYDDDGEFEPSVQLEVELMDLIGCEFWTDAIIKYHKAVGYSAHVLSNTDFVNAY